VETSDADRVAKKLTSTQSAQSRPNQITKSDHSESTATPVPTAQEMQQVAQATDGTLHIPAGQWAQAMAVIQHLSQRIETFEAKMSVLMESLDQVPTITILRETMDDVVSTLTQTMTINSDSIMEHNAQTHTSSTRALNKSLDVNNDRVIKLCNEVDDRNFLITESLKQALNDLLPHKDSAELNHSMDPSPTKDTEITIPSTTASVPPTETRHSPDIDTELGVEANTDSVSTRPEERNMDTAPDEPEFAATEQIDTESHPPQDEEEDHEHPRTSDCHGCNKIGENIASCDHCELPYHFECLIASHSGSNAHYCLPCTNKLFPDNTMPPQQSSDQEGSGLTESSGTDHSDSEVSEYSPKYAAKPMSNSTPSSSSQKYPLRSRTRKK